MLGYIGLLIVVFILIFLALAIHGLIKAGRKTLLPTELINHEMFVERDPVIADVPKREVADSHWYVKTFMRPRRKNV